MARIPVALLASALLALPASAELARYAIEGDQSSLYPTDGTVLRPATLSGTAWIEDDGGGTPSLERLELEGGYVAPFLYESSYVGTYELERRLSVEPGQTGTGDTSSSIDWGALGGWAQTGHLRCPADCFGTQAECENACLATFGFDGTGPLPPLAAESFDSDPWTFAGGGVSFTSVPIELVNLVGGIATEHLTWRGSYVGPVPTFPLLGLLGLGASLAYLGARALGSRRR